LDPFLTAIALCEVAQRAKPIASALKKLRRVGRDIAAAEEKLAALTARTEQTEAEFAARAAALDERERALDARETEFESSLAEREQKLARQENAWRNLGEPETVLRGFQSPQYSPLQKARLAHGLPPGKNVDPLFFSEPDARPAMRIDALSDTSDDPHADRQG